MLQKKKDRTECVNHGDISLTAGAGKVIEVIGNHLSIHLEHEEFVTTVGEIVPLQTATVHDYDHLRDSTTASVGTNAEPPS